MSKILQAVRGMHDFDTNSTLLWQGVEEKIRARLKNFGYLEIRTPILEPTALFARAIGEVTDVVSKEMYSFWDNDEQLTLRPEGTAGCVRACLQNSWIYNTEQRFWYMGAMFRHERPQKGRYRQFHQLGVEVFGIEGVVIDAEIILLCKNLWQDLGIDEHLSLEINSIGSLQARENYKTALVEFLTQYQEILSEDEKIRLKLNPLRLLDSKNPELQKILLNAPKLFDYLDEESKNEFYDLCDLLKHLKIDYKINHNLVRGLDYYNKIVFEWTTSKLGAQSAVCGGGRYDGLVEQLGGKATPAIGFAIGLDRLVLLVNEINQNIAQSKKIDFYIAFLGENATPVALELANNIRQNFPNKIVQLHASGGNFKKQLKRANSQEASLVLLLGEEEIAQNMITIKNLTTGEQQQIAQNQLIEFLQQTR